jgi:carbon monoxide dehydrogenase subunit G
VNRFEARNVSTGHVPVPRRRVWEILRSPDDLAEMTPLLDGISVDGDTWCWKLSGISALGVEVSPSFTERMTFHPESEIQFRHDPPAGARERAGARGVYTLEDTVDDMGGDATQLCIDITLHVDLPLPRASRRAVERVMSSTMVRTGDVFARRLYEKLRVDPAHAHHETVRA